MSNKSSDKTVPDIFLNVGHLLDHFMMLIFAKAAYDSGRYFSLQFDEMIVYGTLGMILFGATAPLAGFLSDFLAPFLAGGPAIPITPPPTRGPPASA